MRENLACTFSSCSSNRKINDPSRTSRNTPGALCCAVNDLSHQQVWSHLCLVSPELYSWPRASGTTKRSRDADCRMPLTHSGKASDAESARLRDPIVQSDQRRQPCGKRLSLRV